MFKKIYLFYVLILFASINAFSSAPFHPQKQLKDLTVTWTDDSKIVALAVKSGAPVFPSNKNSVSLSRNVYTQTHLELLLIPSNKRLAPLTLKIPNTQSKVSITPSLFNKINDNELWLWGATPRSLCGGQSSHHIRFLKKKSLYTNLGGLFAWRLIKEQLPTNTLLYITPQLAQDTPTTISSTAFKETEEQAHAFQCRLHHGNTCPFLFLINGNRFNEKHRVIFQAPVKSKTNIPCPV